MPSQHMGERCNYNGGSGLSADMPMPMPTPMPESSPSAASWDLGPTSTIKRIGLAFAALFGSAALFIPSLGGLVVANDPVETVGYVAASIVTGLTSMIVVDLGLRPLGASMLEAFRLALDPRRPAVRPISWGRLGAGYGGYLALAVGGAAVYANDAAHREDPTFNGMAAIAFGVLFGGVLVAMAVATMAMAPATDEAEPRGDVVAVGGANDAGVPRHRGLGFGAALALALCATLAIDLLRPSAAQPVETRQ